MWLLGTRLQTQVHVKVEHVACGRCACDATCLRAFKTRGGEFAAVAPAAMSRTEFDTPGCPTAPQGPQARPAPEGQILRIGTCNLGIASIASWRAETLQRLAKEFNQFEFNISVFFYKKLY